MALPAWAEGDAGWQATPSRGLVWRRDGDEFTFLWPPHGVGMVYTNLRDGSGSGPPSIHGEVRVERMVNGAAPAHILTARVDLLSSTLKTSLGNNLGRVELPDRDAQPPWAQLIEQSSEITRTRFRQGEPFLDLARHRPAERPGYLLRDFLPAGQPTIIYSRGGTGKSLVAIAICASVVSGLPLARGLDPALTGAAAYLDWEADEDEQWHRATAVFRGFGYDAIPEGRFIYRRMHRPLAEDAGTVEAELSRRGVRVAIIDSLLPATGENAVEGDAAYRVMGAVRRWRDVTPVIVAHVNKAEATTDAKGPKSIYGSMFFEYLARMTWELRKSADVPDGDGMAVGLFNRKYNRRQARPIGLRLSFEGAGDWPERIGFSSWSIDGDATLSGGLSVGARIVSALRRLGPLDTEALAEEVDAEPATVARVARKLSLVTNTTPGRGRGSAATWALRADDYPDLSE